MLQETVNLTLFRRGFMGEACFLENEKRENTSGEKLKPGPCDPKTERPWDIWFFLDFMVDNWILAR